MLDLARLTVSLTKHGAHKIAWLLEKYDKDEMLHHLSGTDSGINIDAAQARKNLSVTPQGTVPEVWNLVRALGMPSIKALTLISIIFSHHELIRTMQESNTGGMRGLVKRGGRLDGKAFTNFAHTIEELGFSNRHIADELEYDLRTLLRLKGIPHLVSELLTLKMRTAGWREGNSVSEEMIANGLHKTLGLSAEELRTWLEDGANDVEFPAKEVAFFSDKRRGKNTQPFRFRPGHRPKKAGVVGVSPPNEEVIAALKHNGIQTVLYERLAAKYGLGCVGTELPTGDGTTIDIVIQTPTFRWFYEIKTALSVRACLRQAIPQLLEYAYWRGDLSRAQKLVVVGEASLTDEAQRYLQFLQHQFHLPIFYEQVQG